ARGLQEGARDRRQRRRGRARAAYERPRASREPAPEVCAMMEAIGGWPWPGVTNATPARLARRLLLLLATAALPACGSTGTPAQPSTSNGTLAEAGADAPSDSASEDSS